MDKACQQRDAAIGIAARRPIFEVAFYRATEGRQLAAYLVVAPGEQLHLEELVAVASGKEPEAQLRLLRAGHLAVVGVALVLLLVAGEPVGEK